MPVTGWMFAAGMLALVGLPPFGLFVSKLALLRAGFATGHAWLMALVLAFLAVAFISLIGHLNRMLNGPPPAGVAVGEGARWALVPLALCVLVLALLGLRSSRSRSRRCSTASSRSRPDDGPGRAPGEPRAAAGRAARGRPRRARPRAALPRRARRVRRLAEALRTEHGAELRLMVGDDRRADAGRFEVHYLFAHPTENWFVQPRSGCRGGPAITRSPPSITPRRSSSGRSSISSVSPPTGHPDPRPLVRHAFWPADYFPLRKDATPREFQDDGRAFPFTEVGGEGVYEIPVGPVHAGVIEPGHFRFSVVGETIIDMKARLYFTHKGTEKLFEGRAPADGIALAERVSGDTTVGHALAYCEALEAAAGTVVPARARWLRVILLEMERLYNHVGDFGMIANDTGYAVAHSHCFRIRERLLRLNKRLTGNRLLRGGIVPGGVGHDLPADLDLAGEVDAAVRDLDEIAALSLRNTLVMDRLEDTGRLTTAHRPRPRRTGLRGPRLGHRRGRAPRSPLRGLRRAGRPRAGAPVRRRQGADAGAPRGGEGIGADSSARPSTRLPAGPLAAPLGPLPAVPARVRAGRGLAGRHRALGDGGRRRAARTASRSWTRRFSTGGRCPTRCSRTSFPDFPLCNKSFNQSYSGNDL